MADFNPFTRATIHQAIADLEDVIRKHKTKSKNKSTGKDRIMMIDFGLLTLFRGCFGVITLSMSSCTNFKLPIRLDMIPNISIKVIPKENTSTFPGNFLKLSSKTALGFI